MNSINIEAIYQNGVLKPNVELDLPENTPVFLTLLPLPAKTAPAGTQHPFSALRGIWAEVQFPQSIELMLQQIRARSTMKLEQLARELTHG